MSELDVIEVGPEEGASASIIWMHGLGADGNDFVPIVPELDLPKVRFIFPNAPMRPVTINQGYVMRAWYDILEGGLNHRQDENGVRDSAALIEMIIQNEVGRGVPANRIILAGFSQGGAMTLFTGLCYKERLAGLMVLSGYLPIAEKTLGECREENLAMPIFMGHGTYDPMVPQVLAKKSYDALTEKGVTIEWHDYPMAHSVCPQEIADIAAWLHGILD